MHFSAKLREESSLPARERHEESPVPYKACRASACRRRIRHNGILFEVKPLVSWLALVSSAASSVYLLAVLRTFTLSVISACAALRAPSSGEIFSGMARDAPAVASSGDDICRRRRRVRMTLWLCDCLLGVRARRFFEREETGRINKR